MTSRIVRRSIETVDGVRCVDISETSDGGFVWTEYRRDMEDTSGWRATGVESLRVFDKLEAALADARSGVCWLKFEKGRAD